MVAIPAVSFVIAGICILHGFRLDRYIVALFGVVVGYFLGIALGQLVFALTGHSPPLLTLWILVALLGGLVGWVYPGFMIFWYAGLSLFSVVLPILLTLHAPVVIIYVLGAMLIALGGLLSLYYHELSILITIGYFGAINIFVILHIEQFAGLTPFDISTAFVNLATQYVFEYLLICALFVGFAYYAQEVQGITAKDTTVTVERKTTLKRIAVILTCIIAVDFIFRPYSYLSSPLSFYRGFDPHISMVALPILAPIAGLLVVFIRNKLNKHPDFLRYLYLFLVGFILLPLISIPITLLIGSLNAGIGKFGQNVLSNVTQFYSGFTKGTGFRLFLRWTYAGILLPILLYYFGLKRSIKLYEIKTVDKFKQYMGKHYTRWEDREGITKKASPIERRLSELQSLHDKGLISDEEFEGKKKELLDKI